jgi:hypothetical protein
MASSDYLTFLVLQLPFLYLFFSLPFIDVAVLLYFHDFHKGGDCCSFIISTVYTSISHQRGSRLICIASLIFHFFLSAQFYLALFYGINILLGFISIVLPCVRNTAQAR